MKFNKGDYVYIRWEMQSRTAGRIRFFPEGTRCRVIDLHKLETECGSIIPVTVGHHTCKHEVYDTKLGKALL
jgi:hypothetical protein